MSSRSHTAATPAERLSPATAPPPVGAAKPREDTPPAASPTRCPACGLPLGPPAPTGRPGRWCSPACRTRAWRARDTAEGLDPPPGAPAASPPPRSDEHQPPAPGAPGRCPAHPGCLIAGCARFLCARPVHINLDRPGRPRRYCSPACRVAEHRRLQ
jgi:hypothetical protein